MSLFKKCFVLWDSYGGIDLLEDSMSGMLEAISEESKKLPRIRRKKLLQEMFNLTKEYDFFWDVIDDKNG